MGELVFKSAGVSTTEIDLSGPTQTGPSGTPAGIIGTANQGPAFVPVTIATFTQFQNIFGESDGKKFGPLAVNEWLKNARSCTFLRVLGVGDGKQRSNSGVVSNAGFFVGDDLIQPGGTKSLNPYANNTAGTLNGRTYFLGTFMSESAESTIFSDAGLQEQNVAASITFTLATYTNVLNTDKIVFTDAAGKTLTATVNSAAGNYNAPYILGDYSGTTAITVDLKTGAMAAAANLCQTITNMLAGAASLKGFGITTPAYTSGTSLVCTSTNTGRIGNKCTVIVTNVAGNFVVDFSAPVGLSSGVTQRLASGRGGAIPILRGVLLAPSGVALALSGNSTGNDNTPVAATAAAASAGELMPSKGALTGSLELSSQNFTLLLNGLKDVEKNIITASFDITSPSYFANVFNTNPLDFEKEGHLLYGHYDIHSAFATITGSGTINAGGGNKSPTSGGKEDIALLLTSSAGRAGIGAAPANVPDYEDFSDRFKTPITPSIISQNFGGAPFSLFQVESLSDGEFANTKHKISIENLKVSTSTTDKYGSFDLIVRDFRDTDEEKQVLESYRGLSLDLNSDRYVVRVIGDQNTFFDFDNAVSNQKIIVEGDYPVRSNFIRIKPSSDLKAGSVPAEALPVGFRGLGHLVTSGSMLSNEADPIYAISTSVQGIIEPPTPYRDTVSLSIGINKRSDSRLYWGVQTSQKTVPAEPNKPSLFNKTYETYAKYFPNFRTDTTNVRVGENPGVADVNGSKLDCDLFNNNKFSLEKLLVRTGSDTYADPEYWLSASFYRPGNKGANATTKVRHWKVSDLKRVGNVRYSKFTTVMQGGFDGLNIFNADRLAMNNASIIREMTDISQFGKDDSSSAAYRKAVDIMGSKSDVDIKLLAIPGIRHPVITDFAITAVENRFDAMYIMDIEERDVLNSVITGSAQRPHVLNTVNNFSNRGLDSSFAAAYFPDVIVQDPTTLGNVQVPPSVAVLGAFSLNDQLAHPWFAPAGFSRGALEAVELAAVRLNRTNLDDLYSADINPLTAFPGTGTVVWGQKTLLASPSALDRVNVRRLLIDIRRKVKNVANSLLFEPNRVETLEKFSALVNPILQSVQEKSGVDRFKVVIDTTTTTQADVENNTIRGKIFLQPTRTAEFISLDFVVTNAGAVI